jgi:WS/DGAT/MGAT family acyltransferase
MPRQLTEQDAIYLYLETPETPMHVGGFSLIELPEGHHGDFHDDYRALIASRMAHVPFMHAKLATLPLDLDRPFWVEADVDLDHHVRRETLPAPGDMKELEELIGRLHSQLLDRSRPLWQFTVIDGLASGNVAIYTKMHHAAMDGAASQTLIATMYDATPAVRTLAPAPAPEGKDRGDVESLVQGVLAHLVRQEIRAFTYVPDLIRALANLLLPNPKTLRWEGLASMPRAPRTPLNVAIDGERIYAARTLPLATVKQVSKLTGTTMNDVLLAVCGGALRGWLEARGALPRTPLTALVPASMRDASEAAVANRNGIWPCSLATDIAGARERLAAIHISASDQKRRFEALRAFPWPDIPAPGIGLFIHELVHLYGTNDRPAWLPIRATW